MSESNYEQASSERTESGQHVGDHGSERPSVGLIATEHNGDAIASSILRAQRHGYRIFVTYTDEQAEGIRFAQELGATVVTPPQPAHAADRESLRQRLAGAAEGSNCSGLVFVADPSRRIDFDSSLAELDGQTVCEAIYETNTGQTATMVGIPAYNEAATIENVVEEVTDVADTVLVIDDGSEDNTDELARAAGATVIEHDLNRGYGAALQTLFVEADQRGFDHLAVVDADGQHDPADIPKMVDRQRESNADLVIGSRFVDGGSTDAPLYRRFGLSVVNLLTNLSMGVVRPRSTISDTQSGFRVYNSRAISSLASDTTIGDGMSASTDILYHAHSNDLEIEEVGTSVHYDVENASSRNPLSHGMALVSNILRTIEKERPILVLGVPGVVSILIGIYIGYWTVSNYIATGWFPVGRAVSSAIFGLAGIFAVMTALILHALNQHLGQ